MMERLTPSERAAIVLHECFGYSHREIGTVLDLSEANCRQLGRRARRRLGQPASRFRPEPEEWRRLVGGCLTAAATGDVAGLEALLADAVIYWGDGGGKAPVAKRPVRGQARVARFFAKVIPRYGGDPRFGNETEIGMAEVNGEMGVLVWSDGVLFAVLVPEIAEGRIAALRIVANPEKLRFASHQELPLSHSATLSGQFDN